MPKRSSVARAALGACSERIHAIESCIPGDSVMENFDELSRRSFLKTSTGVTAAASTFTIIKPELVRGAGNEKLRAGLVGCGGRGTDAAQQFLHGGENVELVAMGDIFEDHLEKS